MATTIQISHSTRERLAALKGSTRMTYDELLNRLMSLVPLGDEEGRYADAFRVGLLAARLDFRDGLLTDHEDLKKRLGL